MEGNENINKSNLKDGYVLLPQPIDEKAHQMLENAGFEVVVAPNPRPETIAPLMKKAKAVVLRTGVFFDRKLIEAGDDLWTISRTGGGVDNVDLAAATDNGVIVTSSLGVNASTVAEHTLSLILALFKEFFLVDREVRRNNFGIRYENHPQDVLGKQLGIIGFGMIGQILAGYFYPLSQTRILAYDPILPEEIKKSFADKVDFVELDELLAQADAVSVHVPLNEQTENMIARRELELMKPGAYLINVSRGGVVHEKDLIAALQQGEIRGAGLDVFEREPIEEGNPLLELDNVILTPHTAALTKECVVRMATEGARRVIDLFKGELPDNVANPDVLRKARWQNLKKS